VEPTRQKNEIRCITAMSHNAISALLISICFFNSSFAEASDGWLESPACISAKEIGSKNGTKFTPQDFASTLVKAYRNAGAHGVEPKTDEINIGRGKAAMIYVEIKGKQHGNLVITSNRSACHAFYSYCAKEGIGSAKACFYNILNKSNGYSHTGGLGNADSEPTTTAGMNQKMDNNINSVDKKLNTVYYKLLHEMPPEFQKKLIQSEKDWINYRDSTVAITAWQESGGSAQEINQDGEYLTLEKNRLKFLESLLNPN